jgi:hypothetical protein
MQNETEGRWVAAILPEDTAAFDRLLGELLAEIAWFEAARKQAAIARLEVARKRGRPGPIAAAAQECGAADHALGMRVRPLLRSVAVGYGNCSDPGCTDHRGVFVAFA